MLNVMSLAAFFAATEQDNDGRTFAYEIDAIARPIMNTQFGYAVAY